MARHDASGGALRFGEARAAYVIVALLLLATFVALLWVPSYAHETPTLGGFPFFYWYSILWLLINALSQLIAYRLLAPRRRRPEPPSEGLR